MCIGRIEKENNYMKKVLFDLMESQPALTSKFHGGGEYIKAVFKNLTDNYLGECEIIVFFNPDKFLDEWIYDIIEKKNIRYYHIHNDSEISKVFDQETIDIFYSGMPYYYQKKSFPEAVRIKGTIHGLRFVEMPSDKYAYIYSDGKESIKERIRCVVSNFYKRKKIEQFRSSIELIDDLICVSNHTKYSILSHYPSVKEKGIEVFYTPQKEAQLYTNEHSPIDSKYILLMGGDRWIKNGYRAVMALEKLFAQGHLADYRVVVVGGLSKKIRSNLKFNSKYIIKGYVETEELEALYKFCDLFVYPSLNEGFGMPPLEAMKYGRTCVVSGVCSLPEVCGDAVYYINPYDIDEIATRILMATENKKSKEDVLQQFNRIYKRQKEDLDKLCEFIIRE